MPFAYYTCKTIGVVALVLIAEVQGITALRPFFDSLIKATLISTLSLDFSGEYPVNLAHNYNTYSMSYDEANDGKLAKSFGINQLRSEGAAFVSGDVLEVAVGTGLQSKFYDSSRIRSFTGIDLSPGMLKEAKIKLRDNLSFEKVKLELMDAEKLQFEDNKFDSVIDTFSMCVIPHPATAIREMERVLKPGGTLVLVENSKSSNPLLGLFQDITEPIVTKISKDCKWNVDILDLVNKNSAADLTLTTSNSVSAGTLVLYVFKKGAS